MARMSQTTKEILQIVIFLLAVGILALVFVIYPLGQTKRILARPDLDEFNPDSLPANDPGPFAEIDPAVDTFRIEPDGLTNLACLYVRPQPDSAGAPQPPLRGTIILLHGEDSDRVSMAPLAERLVDSGYAVCAYDQRASGRSSGEYHGDGQHEAADLGEVISYLGVRDLIHPPLTVVGFQVGAEAALMHALEEPRINAVVAVDPYLTTERWLDILMDEHNVYWMPLAHTMFRFWYEMRSNYSVEKRRLEDLKPVACPTLALFAAQRLADPEVTRLAELSPAGTLTSAARPDDPTALAESVIGFISSAGAVTTAP